MSEPGSEILTARVLDYSGMGFLFVPPEVFVLEVAMNKDPVNWLLVIASFIGCYVVGIVLLAVGLKWEAIKPHLSETLVVSIRKVATSALTWIVMLIIVAFGPVALVYVFSMTASHSEFTSTALVKSQQPAEEQKQSSDLQSKLDTANTQLDATLKELRDTRNQLAAAQSAASVTPPGVMSTKLGEIGAIRILKRSDGLEVLAKSANIKTIEVAYAAYDPSISATTDCVISCISFKIMFDKAYGPFDIVLMDTSSSYMFPSKDTAKIRIAQNTESYLVGYAEIDATNLLGLGSSDIHDWRLSISKRTY